MWPKHKEDSTMIITLIWTDIMDVIYLFLQIHSYSNRESSYRFKIIYISKSEATKLSPKIFNYRKKKNTCPNCIKILSQCNYLYLDEFAGNRITKCFLTNYPNNYGKLVISIQFKFLCLIMLSVRICKDQISCFRSCKYVRKLQF